ncbi:hypothetical protein [Kushneria aurantia]|uniref:Uncharacterized protein n=1 Tax=Kushneria aurantia TaxID=504092 RepID=A0ABV6G1G4_9GAMM|nr:hypothetical protein [Kushneria aurantia]
MDVGLITPELLARCRREYRVQHQRSQQSFDHVGLDDRKELSQLVEQALRDGDSYASIAERHPESNLTEGELTELIGPEQALRDRIERFRQTP